MYPRHTALKDTIPAAPVLHHGLGDTGEHRRDEGVRDDARYAVARGESRLGHPDPQVPGADQQRVVGLQHVGLVRQVGQLGPARAEGFQHSGALPPRTLHRADRAAFLYVATPVQLALAIEGGQRLVHPQV